MKTIILYGGSGSGKTTAIRILYYILLYLGARIVSRRNNPGFGGDFKCILSFENKSIYLYSMGDVASAVDNAISDAAAKHCDVCICALNNNLVTAKNRLSKYMPVYIDKTGCRDDEGMIADIHRIIAEL